MADYIPRTDAEFDTYAANFVAQLDKKKVALGLAPAALAPTTAALTDWQAKYANAVAKRAEAAAAVQDKDDAKDALTAEIRKQGRSLRANPAATDADFAELGLSVPDTRHTPAAVPSTRPVLTIDTSKSLEHTLNWVDEGTPNREAKPEDVHACEIRMQVGGAAPADPEEMQFVAMDTATPYLKRFAGEHAGKLVYYRARWINTTSQPGPWSQLASATVTA